MQAVMLVYGDPSDSVRAVDLLGRVRRRLAEAEGDAPGGEARRALLIEAPEAWRLRVKVPEGFAFYTLYPEQYARAAERWLEDHAGGGAQRALVVGVRSIGTTLSAVVAAVLARAGWPVRRITVRPGGHPFRRGVEISPGLVAGAAFGLIVDEGPGLSGSSMASVADALAGAGMAADGISLFPGHGRGPGAAGSEAVRQWWRRCRCYAVRLDEVTWRGRRLPEALAARTGGDVVRVEDLGAGQWRRIAFPGELRWPAVWAPFERAKYRVVRRDGTAVLWKFEGLAGGVERSVARLEELARRGWTVAPEDQALGFVATRWKEGMRPLRDGACPRATRDGAFLRVLSRYLTEPAGSVMDRGEQWNAMERLREMVRVNLREAFGEALEGRFLARPWPAVASDHPAGRSGDGRLAPVEWVWEAGRWWKFDCAGHDRDHSWPGRQPLLWDLAGAMVEWRLPAVPARLLAERVEAAGGGPLTVEAVDFHRLAYAAFRLGQCVLCAGVSDAGERRRLGRAERVYRAEIQGILR